MSVTVLLKKLTHVSTSVFTEIPISVCGEICSEKKYSAEKVDIVDTFRKWCQLFME